MYCVRVGFQDKRADVDPVEYAKCLSGVTRIPRNITKNWFDIGFDSMHYADIAVKKTLFFDGLKVPHFRPCSSNEALEAIHFTALPTSLERDLLSLKLMNELGKFGRVLFFEQEAGYGISQLSGDTAFAMIAHDTAKAACIPSRFRVSGIPEDFVLNII
ncbi:hypothetical protein DSO57_1027330 [Entomophthora muscae]|uniref:Uncharacterized protein n=1 Tax=Entomophthora muscae TaxID=34485 RepID=A0ACC2SEF0_9FUNG|nr:hypothetical protein DSO57_1027330 [Entomophthora muscae]